MRAVLASQEPWDHEPLVSWLVLLSESLVPPEVGAEIVERAEQACAQNPLRASMWLAGTCADMARSLPANDPWRTLSVRVVNSSGPDVVFNGSGQVPEQTGATSVAGPFGSWRDGTDLVPLAHRSLLADPGLVGLVRPLSPASASFLAVSSRGWEQGRSVLEMLCPGDGGAMFEVAADAIRWATWRRRVYTGPEDPHLATTGMLWLEMVARGTVDEDQRADNAEAGFLDDDLYEPVL